jgi:hypothetical protein
MCLVPSCRVLRPRIHNDSMDWRILELLPRQQIVTSGFVVAE